MRGGEGRGRTARKLAKARTQVIAQCVTETRTVQRSSPVTYWVPHGKGEPPKVSHQQSTFPLISNNMRVNNVQPDKDWAIYRHWTGTWGFAVASTKPGSDRTGSRIGSQTGLQIGSWIGSRIGSWIGSRIGSRTGSWIRSRKKIQNFVEKIALEWLLWAESFI